MLFYSGIGDLIFNVGFGAGSVLFGVIRKSANQITSDNNEKQR